MGEHGNRIFGAAMVLVGLLMLTGELVGGPLRLFWPVALALIGGVVLLEYRRKRDDSGKVFTGTTLLLLAVFLLLVVTGVLEMKQHWPFFVAAPGFGLLALARTDPRRRDAMVPGWMAIGAAAVLYFFTLGLFVGLLEIVFELLGLVLKVLVPIGLIGLGAWMLFQQAHRKEKAEDVPEKVEPEPYWGGRATGSPEAPAESEEAAPADSDAGDADDTPSTDDAADEDASAEPYVTPPPVGEPHPPIEDAEVEPDEHDHDEHDHDEHDPEHDPERRD